MRPAVRFYALVGILIVTAALLMLPGQPGQAQTPQSGMLITGFIQDHQGTAVQGASVSLLAPGTEQPLAETLTQPDGRFTLAFTQNPVDGWSVRITREHFSAVDLPLDSAALQALRSSGSAVLPEVTLMRRIGLSFWIATLVFIGMLVSIALGRLHSTLSALLGATVIFAVSYLGRPLSNELYIFDFAGALRYVDWNVIFLIMGMMIIIAAVERTGIFQWLAFSAYRLSGGRIWLLMPILMVIAGIASAFLDNVTTMLLMTPITVQISLAMGVNPLVLLLPEVMSSNVAGISTLVGTPTNILIGSYGHISFNAFFSNLTPGVLLAMLGLIIYSEYINRKDLHPQEEKGISNMLLEKLAERARITEPVHLKKAGVGGGLYAGAFRHRRENPPAAGGDCPDGRHGTAGMDPTGYRRDDRSRGLDHPGILHHPIHRRRRHSGGWPDQFHRRRDRPFGGWQPVSRCPGGYLVERVIVDSDRQHPLHSRHAARDRIPDGDRSRRAVESIVLLSVGRLGYGRQRLIDWSVRQYGHRRHRRTGRLLYYLQAFYEEGSACPVYHGGIGLPMVDCAVCHFA